MSDALDRLHVAVVRRGIDPLTGQSLPSVTLAELPSIRELLSEAEAWIEKQPHLSEEMIAAADLSALQIREALKCSYADGLRDGRTAPSIARSAP